jgi:hypothetical protein
MAVSLDEARSLALSLPEAVEQDHHGAPSFRVGGKIFATLWSEQRLNVMLDEGGILTAVEAPSGGLRGSVVGQAPRGRRRHARARRARAPARPASPTPGKARRHSGCSTAD